MDERTWGEDLDLQVIGTAPRGRDGGGEHPAADVHPFLRELGILDDIEPGEASGEVTRVVGLSAEGEGLSMPVGGQCRIRCREGREIPAEVVGFRENRALIVPHGDARGIAVGDRVVYEGRSPLAPVGEAMIGRVIGGTGEPIDGMGPVQTSHRFPLYGVPLNPMDRKRIREVLGTGVRGIDGVLTCGRGARLGIFSGSGVGKSVLLGMIARNTDAELSVIGLIGERGREVREFIEKDLGPEGLRRSIVVAATSEAPAITRIRAAHLATAIAEFFRGEGRDVVLLMDSVTRVAVAQRELGLSAGEPPATRGYPPSVFALLARLLERAGPGKRGSVSGFYTVLVEADDLHDPIGDCVRGILDGHIWLNRSMANRGHYPAIDPLSSISRVMPDVISEEHLASAREVTADVARYREVEDLIHLGAYVAGKDARVDLAIQRMPAIEAFLKQRPEERSSFEETGKALIDLVTSPQTPAGREPSRGAERPGGS